MIKLTDKKQIYKNGALYDAEGAGDVKSTISWRILSSHNTGDDKNLKIKFDAMASHDITYVGIIQTARASGLEKFPVPYVLTNCHNSLCAVGGTINEDDHAFGLSAAKKYGGIFVPAHLAVIHQYMREMHSGCGAMILGSDSHTRYGALGTMAIGEGGGELAKQLLGKTYDIACPEIIAVRLTGAPAPGVGPQDVALALIGAVFESGFVKNKILEFIGDGIAGLSADYRNGIDVMTTETTCLSSIWQTDEVIERYFAAHGRERAYKKLEPEDGALYDGAVEINLSQIKPMIALPFHPSNVYTLDDLCSNSGDILRKCEKEALENSDGAMKINLTGKITRDGIAVEQGIIAGCAGGTYENIEYAANELDGQNPGNGRFTLSVYPASQPVYMQMLRGGAAEKLMRAGANLKTAFCGPCFGAGDVPANNDFSVRHSTRNFPNREGSKPNNGQVASVALMDARSIAATARAGGILTPATRGFASGSVYYFDSVIYKNRVYDGVGRPDCKTGLTFGPNITDWPKMDRLADNLLLVIASVINDPVTTTDELIPSGETSSYRSNPLKLAEHTLSRKDPGYVGRAKKTAEYEEARKNGKTADDIKNVFAALGASAENTAVGSAIYAAKPGDGSAREQAASCQRVLGGCANIAVEYATKRYRSNLINWGLLPFVMEKGAVSFKNGDFVFIRDIKNQIASGADKFTAVVLSDGIKTEITLSLPSMTKEERDIVSAGCLINYYA